MSTETCFSKESAFDFSLLLFGRVNQSLPYFIYAFEQMGKIGIGKRIGGKRGQYVLQKVESGDRVLYSDADRKLNMDDHVQELTVRQARPFPEGTFRLKMRMITPLRLKFQNRLKAELPFHILVRAMLRRVSSLCNFFGDGEPALDYRGLVKRAEEVHVLDSELTWFDWKRYSSRQDKSMLMGGMAGSITFEGELGPYMPLIDFCEKVHIGKQTSFGLGKIEAEIGP